MNANQLVGELLASWGCNEATIKIFVDNDICVEVLPYLTSKELEELVPSFGMRKLIITKINELRKEDDENACPSIASTVTTVDDVAIYEVSETESSVVTTFFQDLFPDFDLKTLLETSPMGKSVLKYYNINSRLDNTRRTRLVDIIVKHLYNHVIKNRLRPDEYNRIAAKIILLFPTECLGTYYVPAIRKADSPTKKPMLAKGKLIDKIRNLMYKCEEAVPKRKKRIRDSVSDCFEEETSNGTSLENDTDVLWLKINSEPWTEVLEKWEKTYILRRNDQQPTVSDFIAHWPLLRKLQNDALINYDFKKLFPGKELRLFIRWSSFFEKILTTSAFKKDTTLDNLLEIRNETASEDTKFLAELIALPHIIPPKGRVVLKDVSKKCHWKFSTLEAVDAIVIQAKNPGCIQQSIDEHRDKVFARKQTVQPYLLYEGLSIENCKHVYIVVDQLFLEVESAKKAFDVLFKIFHVFNARYPVEADYIYTLIQKGVYDIHTSADNVPPSIVNILSLVSK